MSSCPWQVCSRWPLLLYAMCLCFACCHAFVAQAQLRTIGFFPLGPGMKRQPFAPLASEHLQHRARAVPRRLLPLHGIPRMTKFLSEAYPVIKRQLPPTMHVDNLYFDSNAIIHSCVHSNQVALQNTTQQEMFDRVFNYIDTVYKLVKPKNLVIIAVDGVAPRAKMNQQRARRFNAAREQEEFVEGLQALYGERFSPDSIFDRNSISPGTPFMMSLLQRFREWIAHKCETDPLWSRGPKVVFSGSDVPGEGEHKVLRYLRHARKHDPNWRPDLRHCIFGPDADLVMLGLVTHEPSFLIMREIYRKEPEAREASQLTIDDFELVDLSLLRKSLAAQFRSLKSQLSFEWDLERLIDDFVLICVLVGNDFLPNIPHLEVGNGGLANMISSYIQLLPKLQGYLTSKTQIHLARLELFIQKCSDREPLYFQAVADRDDDDAYRQQDYKNYYYQTKLGMGANDTEAKRKVVEAYIHGLFWVHQYYHSSAPTWKWYYPYLYAPPGSDIIDIAGFNTSFEQGRPFAPLLQLLAVMPPRSAKLLPRVYRPLVSENTSALAYYYPRDFVVDSSGKHFASEGVVHIPFINEHDLLEEVNKVDHTTELSAKEKERNLLGQEEIFIPKLYDARSHQVRRKSRSFRPMTPAGSGKITTQQKIGRRAPAKT